ncbi:ABC transporter ATP-binding protein [Thiomicrospira microaerophila]|uniref:ABC transporter ATP-binding protein n=1 Tax=Thiomicrospira microaerophila TaxID=406020 RepID=UPI0005C9D0F3|nr:ABC transporter ATP-binding protein [Thiomicrospira microaerophila]
MLKLIKQLFTLLTPDQRKRFYGLQVLVVIMAFAEIVGVASIIPFMALVGDMSLLQQDTLIAQVYQTSGIASETQFVFLLGVAVLVMLFISAMISMFTTWRLSMFASKTGTEIADRLYSHYLKQGWLFHASGSSAQLTKKIANESARVTFSIIMPLMQMNARIALALFMSIAIFAYDPKVAIIGLVMFAIAYFILYKLVRTRLRKNGQTISTILEQRYRLMNEGFGGIKDVLLLGRDDDFIQRFNKTGHLFAYSQGNNVVLAQVPRYFMELIAFGSMIALVLYLIASHEGNLGMVLPILSVYALAGFKLLPAFQQIYTSIAAVKGNIAAFESIQQDLTDSKNQNKCNAESNQNAQANLHPKNSISLENITFTYPGKTEPALNKLNMQIKANSVIGIVGPSGSGKSTVIDILLGLIEPQQGTLSIDGQPITDQNRRAWQNTIGFVPQSIFLSEGSIAENVAFGIPEKDINLDQVNKALSLAHLDELVQSLDQGIHTKVGERGVQLSGGQRQRIGIARALYHEADVLVFDEATSALDGITEKLIMEAIHDFSGQKTIIMIAHRLKTVEKCDQLFMISKGEVIAVGTYDYLIKNNNAFKEITNHA